MFLVFIDKAFINATVISKKYVEINLKETSFNDNSRNDHSISSKCSAKIIDNSLELSECLGFTLIRKKKTLHIMWWIQKIHKNPVGICLIIAPKLCSAKKISKPVPHIFKLIHSQTEILMKIPNHCQVLTNSRS